MVLGQVFGLKTLIRQRFSNNLESGIVSVNNVVVSDPRVPFGGVKKSGFGRVVKIWHDRICQYKIS